MRCTKQWAGHCHKRIYIKNIVDSFVNTVLNYATRNITVLLNTTIMRQYICEYVIVYI